MLRRYSEETVRALFTILRLRHCVRIMARQSPGPNPFSWDLRPGNCTITIPGLSGRQEISTAGF